MRKLAVLIILFIGVFGCSISKKPVFLKVDDVQVVSVQSDTIRLKANAYFKNPNDVGGKIATDQIKVIVNGAELAQVSSEEFKVPSRKDFTIPLSVVIPAKQVFENNRNGILGGLINTLLNKTIKIQFKGDLKYKVLGFSKVYPVDKTQEIKLK
ncbi:MAG: LEA type 2 family protein [Polaribacter sp.]